MTCGVGTGLETDSGIGGTSSFGSIETSAVTNAVIYPIEIRIPAKVIGDFLDEFESCSAVPSSGEIARGVLVCFLDSVGDEFERKGIADVMLESHTLIAFCVFGPGNNVEVGERFTGLDGVDDLEMLDLDVFHLMGSKSEGILQAEALRVGSVLDKLVVAQLIQKRTGDSTTLLGNGVRTSTGVAT